ncbi:MAG TPA: hypothetical protein VFD32_21640 [Dehalococcoidia bacterium]|nr:hypothetical protein [Dehalococcoidia bacterium]
MHIAGIVALFCVMALLLGALGGMRRAQSAQALREWLRQAIVMERLVAPLGLLAFLPAAYLVSDRWSWRDGWVSAALIGLIVTVALGPLLLRGRLLAARRRLENVADGVPQLPVRLAVQDPALWVAGQMMTTLPSGVLVLMVFKPNGAVSALILVVAGLLGVLAAAPALSRYRRLEAEAAGQRQR